MKAEKVQPQGQVIRLMPAVPRHGPATLQIPKVLLPVLTEVHQKVSQPKLSPRHRQQVLPIDKALTGSRKAPVAVESFKQVLCQDSALRPRYPDSILAPIGERSVNSQELEEAINNHLVSTYGVGAKESWEQSASCWDISIQTPIDSFIGLSTYIPSLPSSPPKSARVATSSKQEGAHCRASSVTGRGQYFGMSVSQQSWNASRADSRFAIGSRGLHSPPWTGQSHRRSSRGSTTLDASPEQALRRQHLYDSFAHSVEEIKKRLSDLDERPLWQVPTSAEPPRSSSTIPSEAGSQNAFARKTTSSERPQSASPASDSVPAEDVPSYADSFEDIRQSFAGSKMGALSPQKLASTTWDLKDEQSDTSGTFAAREELLRATRLLNFYRWLCRLPPVELDTDRIDACEILNSVLMSRKEVFLPQNNILSRRMASFGLKLGGFMGRGRALIFNKEGSITSAIQDGITSSHTAGWSCSSTAAPIISPTTSCSPQNEVYLRAERHRLYLESRLNYAGNKNLQPSSETTLLMRLERRHVDPTNFPAALTGHRVFWTLSNAEGTFQQSAIKSGRRAHSPPFVTSRPSTQNGPRQTPRPVSVESSRGKVREVVWGPDESARRKEWARACDLSWGDKTGTVLFRRHLLNPKLSAFGASRNEDICVLWSGEDMKAATANEPDSPGLQHQRYGTNLSGFSHLQLWEDGESFMERDELQDESACLHSVDDSRCGRELNEDPLFVSFPPQGICPLDVMHGSVPTWTIMPDGRHFQPTQVLKVQMWRVKLIRDCDEHESTHGDWKSSRPRDAQRLEEILVPSVTCDCSPKGNPFCVIFRPALPRLVEGDQFEVLLSGLTGISERQHFFYEFRSLHSDEKDFHLLREVGKFKDLLDNMDIYEVPIEGYLGRQKSGSSEERIPDARRKTMAPEVRSRPSDAGIPSIRRLSHPNQAFEVSKPQCSILLQCKVLALTATLNMTRVGGNQEIKRAVLVLKVGDRFIVRLKFPTSGSAYKLSFQVATFDRPDRLLDHPLTYSINTLESCACPLNSIEHPLRERFGFCPQAPIAKKFGVTIVAPLDYVVRTGYVYFLVFLDPALAQIEEQPYPNGVIPKTSLFNRLEQESLKAAEQTESEKLSATGSAGVVDTELTKRKTFRKMASSFGSVPQGAVWRMQRAIQKDLSEQTQDACGNAQFDLVVVENGSRQPRFVQELKQRTSFPELLDGMLHFGSLDENCRVELYLRISGEVPRRAPMKIGEWIVALASEYLPSNL